jgi:hypothetical protein
MKVPFMEKGENREKSYKTRFYEFWKKLALQSHISNTSDDKAYGDIDAAEEEA